MRQIMLTSTKKDLLPDWSELSKQTTMRGACLLTTIILVPSFIFFAGDDFEIKNILSKLYQTKNWCAFFIYDYCILIVRIKSE